MYIERLEFGDDTQYNPLESSIHLGRYLITKQFCEGKKVLDLACGEGYGSYAMAKYWGAIEVHGIDVDTETVEKAKRNFSSENIHFKSFDAEKVNDLYEENTFDLIISFETIEHLQHPETYLKNMKRLIKVDGTIIISCPNDHWYYKTTEESNPFHIRKYTFEEFVSLCESKLGKANQYMVGMPTGGFSNIALDSSLITDDTKNMSSMFEFNYQDSLLLPTNENINPTNSSYFLGVWSSSALAIQNTTCTYPISMDNSRVVDYFTFLKVTENIRTLELGNSELNERVKVLEEQIKMKENEMNIVNSNNKKLTLANRGTIKENEFIKHNILLTQNIVSEKQYQLDTLQNEMNDLLNSNSWKITAPLRKLIGFLKR